jgi:molybdopterin converting factor small subunit
MAHVTFPAVLARHVDCPPVDVAGATVRAALDAAFAANPRLRGYVLDDDGSLRFHMAIFVDGRILRDRRKMSDAIAPDAQIHVFQAISGG